jgi:hypothetical protein
MILAPVLILIVLPAMIALISRHRRSEQSDVATAEATALINVPRPPPPA